VRVAVPGFNGRVSSVFDWARELIVVDHEGHRETARHRESIAGIAPPLRPGYLAKRGVETLVCGGISQALAEMILQQGIRVVPGIAGDIDAVLGALREGRLKDPRFAMPAWDYVPPPLEPGHRVDRRRRGGRPRRWPGNRGT
jgi:predicted Fe-Mo cluster-binding NifX family protein